LVTPPNLFLSFAMWTTCGRNKFVKAGLWLIWYACIWVLWRARNDCGFNSGVVNSMVIVDKIKLLSWQWFIGRLATSPCLLYEWQWSPIDCLHGWCCFAVRRWSLLAACLCYRYALFCWFQFADSVSLAMPFIALFFICIMYFDSRTCLMFWC
jgi:hypothetical protein